MQKRSLINNFHIRSGKDFVNILLILISLWIFARPLKSIGIGIYNNLGATINNIIHFIPKTKSNLDQMLKSKEEVVTYKEKIINLESDLLNTEDEISKVNDFKNILQLKKSLKYKSTGCNIIGRSADNWHKQIIIDKGKKNNLRVGNSVLSHKGVIGQLIEVNKNSSIVQLISDPGFKLGCKVKGKNILGIISGVNSKKSQVDFIPVGSSIEIGDEIITSGISADNLRPNYPKGHLIGRVSKVNKRKKKASDLYVEVKLAEDLTNLTEVLVFTP